VPQPASVQSFLSSLGINAHAGNANGAYTNSSMVVTALNYLGISTVRDRFTDLGTGSAAIGAMAAAGIKFDFVISSDMPAKGAAGLSSYVAGLQAFQAKYAGSIFAVEGLNEVNLQPFNYNGSGSLAAAASYQKALYTAVKGNSALAGIPVINLSVGLESDRDYAAIGDLGAYSDFANAHAYTATGWQADKVQEASLARAKGASKGDPVVITETGYTTMPSDTGGLGVNESAQAKLTLTALLHAFENGSSKTFLYELFDSSLDPSGHAREFNFGLFKTDGSPKQAAVAVHNLTSILGHVSAAGAYTLKDVPSDGHSMALTKGNGAYDLLLWRDVKAWDSATQRETVTAPKTITVDLGGVQKTVFVYDPLNGTTPIATYTNVSSITVAVGDRPLIVEVGAKGAFAEIKPTVAPDLTTTADGLVAQIDRLAKSTGLQSIKLTGSTVLQVSSEATMRYMLSNYGGVLSKIAGSYSFRVTENGGEWKQERSYDASGQRTSKVDYGYVGGVLNNVHREFADGTVMDEAYKGGKLALKVTAAANGDRVTINYDTATGKAVDMAEISGGTTTYSQYKNGILSARTIEFADGSRENDSFDPTGRLTMMVRIDKAGVWTTTQLDGAGKPAAVFIQRPDGSGENTRYGITGQAWTSQRQVTAVGGKVTLVERRRADDTLVSTERYPTTGGSVVTSYDAQGARQVEVTVAANGDRTTLTYNPGRAELLSRVEQTAAAVTTTSYAAGAVVERTIARTDGSRMTESFANGIRTRVVEVGVDKTFTTRLFDTVTGKPTKLFVDRADGTKGNTTYGITGKTYVTEAQEVSKEGKVVSLTRRHGDGSLDFTDVTATNGTRTMTTYDLVGRRTGVTIVAVGGATTTEVYDAVSGALKSRVVRGLDGRTVTQRFDADVLLEQHVDEGDVRTSYTFDAAGNRKSQLQVDAAGNKTTTLYDPAGGAVTAVYLARADGSGETRLYGITGKPWTSEVQTTDKTGKALSLVRTRADGTMVYGEQRGTDGVVATTYDSAGRKQVETTTGVDGAVLALTFAAGGDLLQRVTKAVGGATTTATYAAGIITSMVAVAADGTRTATSYDAGGVKTRDQSVDGAGNWTTTLFDATGQVTRRYIKNADGSGENFSYGVTGQSWTSEHQVVDALGKVVTVTRRNADGSLAYTDRKLDTGARQLATFDGAGRLKQEVTIAVDGGETVLDFDTATGKVLTRQERSAAGDVAVSRFEDGTMVARRTQMANGTVVLEAFRGDGSWSADTLNAAGSKTKAVVVDAAGQWTTTMIDPATGRAMMKFVDTPGQGSENTTYNIVGQGYTTQVQRLDAAGKVLSVVRTGADGSMRYSETHRADGAVELAYYDGKGRKTSEASVLASGTRETRNFDVASGALVAVVTEAAEGTTAVSYTDGKPRRSEFKGADGSRRIRDYDAKGVLTSDVTVSKTGDWTTLKYDAAGVLTAQYVTYADGTAENRQYNPSGDPYAEQRQRLAANGKVVAIERYRSDGTLSFTMAATTDGGRTEWYRDAQGRVATELQVRANGDRIETRLDPATGTPTGSTQTLTNGTRITSTFQQGVLVRRTTQPATGAPTTETFAIGNRDVAGTPALVRTAVLIGDAEGRITGGIGDELLLADRRDMVLTGGGGDDRFYIRPGASATIRDFGAGHDLLDLSTFADKGYQPTIALEDGNTTLRFAGGELVTLIGITPDRLKIADTASGVWSLA
jgi:hypothetical protein